LSSTEVIEIPFNGKIDEVAIWNRTLSENEIIALYKRGDLSINVSYRTSNDSVTYSDWHNASNSTSSVINEKARYLQYKTILNTEFGNYTPILNDVTINYTGLFTDSFGNYNFTLTAPASDGTYAIKINGTYSGTIPGEQTVILTVAAVPSINNQFTVPTYPGFNENVTFVVNATVESGVSINSVNFTIFDPSGTEVLALAGYNNGNNDIYNVTYNVSVYGTWNWTATVYDNIGQTTVLATQEIILMQITENLNSTLVIGSAPVTVSGHINLSNGTNVSNNVVNLFLNETSRGGE